MTKEQSTGVNTPGTYNGWPNYETWLVGKEGEWKEYKVLEARLHITQVVAQLEGLTDRDAALKLKGSEVAVPRETLPKPDDGSYYWSDLIGLAVVNTRGESLGAVKEMFSNGAQDVIDVVAGEAGEVKRLIPWTVVQSVDLKARRILVEWQLDW